MVRLDFLEPIDVVLDFLDDKSVSGVLLVPCSRFLIPVMLMDSRKAMKGRLGDFVYEVRREFDFRSRTSESGRADLGLDRRNDFGGGAISEEEPDSRESLDKGDPEARE